MGRECFGEIPSALNHFGGVTTSAKMEELSFWFLGVTYASDASQFHWLASTDTFGRLNECCKRLSRRGALNLPGAHSWMNTTNSATNSLFILLAIVVVIVGRIYGVFDIIAARKGQFIFEG